MIDQLVGAGAPVDRCYVILGVTRQNYYKHNENRPQPHSSAGKG